ncbi:hypothetical protein LCI18_002713 [Fusarium solani-melongenae]|uniref:Uncharacterized protein n=1 Tax=Fusarium solani subsp. cucurbitae TaxID=2747967 RepID=A0ACD3YS45_FUSSC|nr:hypothetical protein LCI18_002713 [Fusarium solani-melongenae]
MGGSVVTRTGEARDSSSRGKLKKRVWGKKAMSRLASSRSSRSVGVSHTYLCVETSQSPQLVDPRSKARLVHVRLISMAMTGFFYTFKRPRTAPMMSMLKYDPIVRKKVLFLETKKRK